MSTARHRARRLGRDLRPFLARVRLRHGVVALLPLVLVSSNLTYAEIKLPGVDRPVTLNRAAWGDPIARTASAGAAADVPLIMSEPLSGTTSVRVRDAVPESAETAAPEPETGPSWTPYPTFEPDATYPDPSTSPSAPGSEPPSSPSPDDPSPAPSPDDPSPSPDDPSEPPSTPEPDDPSPTPSPDDPSPTPSPDEPAPRPQLPDPEPTDTPSYPPSPEPEPEPKPEICIVLPQLPICIGLPG